MKLSAEYKAKMFDYLIENCLSCEIGDDKFVWLNCSEILRQSAPNENIFSKLDVLKELENILDEMEYSKCKK